MARRATRLSPKALLRLRQKLIDEGLYEEDRPEDTIGNRIQNKLVFLPMIDVGWEVVF